MTSRHYLALLRGINVGGRNALRSWIVATVIFELVVCAAISAGSIFKARDRGF
jgi:uncharacterized protein (DUF1697 family)